MKEYTCNANEADQFESWLNEETPILPRKYRTQPIQGEQEEQTKIRLNIAIEIVKGEIELLRMRSNNHQRKVIDMDEHMHS